MKVLFLGKSDKEIVKKALAFLTNQKFVLTVVTGEVGSKLSKDLKTWEGDFIFSFLSPWILPDSLLAKAKVGAYNWHPAPPEMPGFGGASFAIYNGKAEFGYTAHVMTKSVDAGPIIDFGHFPVEKSDTVLSLSEKSYDSMLVSFKKIVEGIQSGKIIESKSIKWGSIKTSRRQLDDLCEITLQMDREEAERRIKANTFGESCWAYLKIGERKYSLNEK